MSERSAVLWQVIDSEFQFGFSVKTPRTASMDANRLAPAVKFATCILPFLLFAGCVTRDTGKQAAPPPRPTTNAAPAATQVPKPKEPQRSSTASVSTNPPALKASGWKSLFDGKTLTGLKITDFAGHGEVKVDDGKLILEMGVMTGVTWTSQIPRMNYEVSLEAMRVEGSDFFCGLTFPVGKDPCSLIVGGWGGGVVGLSSLDGEDAANNETTQYMNFQKGRWFLIQLRVRPDRIQAWIDQELIVDVVTTGKRISIRSEVEESMPFGVASWATTAALRNIKIRQL